MQKMSEGSVLPSGKWVVPSFGQMGCGRAQLPGGADGVVPLPKGQSKVTQAVLEGIQKKAIMEPCGVKAKRGRIAYFSKTKAAVCTAAFAQSD
jgi:hypothetical protein